MPPVSCRVDQEPGCLVILGQPPPLCSSPVMVTPAQVETSSGSRAQGTRVASPQSHGAGHKKTTATSCSGGPQHGLQTQQGLLGSVVGQKRPVITSRTSVCFELFYPNKHA